MSGHAHANFENYANRSTTLDDDRGIIHTVGPCRDPLWDNISLWLATRQFTAVLVRPERARAPRPSGPARQRLNGL